MSYFAHAPNRRGINRCLIMSDVCLSRTSGLSREQRGRCKIGTEVAHVTRDSGTTFKVKRSKVRVTKTLYSPPCWRVRQLQRWGWERVGREKLLLGYVAVCSAARGTSASTGGEVGGISWRPPTYSLLRLSLLCRKTN